MIHPSRLTPRRQAALLQIVRWVSVLVAAFLLLIFGYYLYANVLNRAPAIVSAVERGPAVATVYGTFTINPNNSLTLFAQNAGYLHSDPKLYSTYASQGTPMKQDQLMATVDDDNLNRQVKQAQTEYDAALAHQKNGPASSGALKSAQDQLDAYSKLRGDAVPRVTREASQNEVNRLTLAVDNERLDLQRLTDASASVLKTYQDQLKRTEVRSPFPGVVTVINFNNNAYVLPNQALFTVATAETYVSGLVNEEDVGALRPGMKAELHLYSAANKNYIASLDAILPSPETNSSRYYVNLHVVDPPPTPFLYGLTGDMLITVGRKENALIVPARAVNTDQVLIVDNGVVEQRTVKVGFKSADFAEVASGLNEGEDVIVEDQDAFHPGQRVRSIKSKSASAKN